MKYLFCSFLLINLNLPAQQLTGKQYREDFEYFWKTLQQDYCYWDKKNTDWTRVHSSYAASADTISSIESFILFMEQVFNEIYDHHASLNRNTRQSQRLIPSGTDIWAAYRNGKPLIIEVRIGFGAELSGLKSGMELIAFNDIPVEKALQKFLPKSLKKADQDAKDAALRLSLAGKFIDDRKITVKDGVVKKDFYPDRPSASLINHQYPSDIESKIFPGGIGYIRINNRLWDNQLIPLFDSVLKTLNHTKSMILDLRETPGGGNTTVARAIIGSFITREGFYQKHELTAEERSYGIKRSWLEIVSPRKSIYTKPLVLLVNHWTGSVGEGITIGFDALKRATIIGTLMAGLNGANYSYTMPNSRIGFSFPVEKLFHVNGQPRENYKPTISIDLAKQKKGEDLILQKALQFLSKSGKGSKQ